MEVGGGSNSSALLEDSQLNDLTDILAENVAGFKKFVDEAVEAVDQDENFNEMTVESYDQKKFYMKEQLQELSNLHNSLADQCGVLIEEISINRQSLLQSSDSSSSPQVSQILGQEASTSTGFHVHMHPDGGGFYLAKGKGPSHSGLKSSVPVPPVNVAALKVKETKDPGFVGSDSGSESSTSSVNKPAVPAVNDDALKVEETEDPEVLVEKVSNLEDEVVRLKKKIQSLTVENDELKQEVEQNLTDISVYMSESKLDTKALKEELQASKEAAIKIEEHRCNILEEKISNITSHHAKLVEMNDNMTQCMSDIVDMQTTHEEKEKIWNDFTEQLKHDLKVKSELLEEVNMTMEALVSDKSVQNNLIHNLKTELVSVKSDAARLFPSLDDVEKLADELQLKVEELERAVDKQREVVSGGLKK
ncbi:hypothetical protein QVD17_35865 [Tagetes erecta]|uniref:Uncharacterized protein n=1 Tax=Tagetes erecta TaxID=13708 RepID=A0AAD8NGV4_TARER|nr:hypothetical protein QVD17_35865 [Tagetes erecta]